MGKNSLRLLRFALKYAGWHSYGFDRSTRDSVKTLQANGLIEVNEFRQFRLNINDHKEEE